MRITEDPLVGGAGTSSPIDEAARVFWRRLDASVETMLIARSPRLAAIGASRQRRALLVEDTATLRQVLPDATAVAKGEERLLRIRDDVCRRKVGMRAACSRADLELAADGTNRVTVRRSRACPNPSPALWSVLPQALSEEQFAPFRRWFDQPLPGRAFCAYALARRLTRAPWQEVLERLGTPWPEVRVQPHRRRINRHDPTGFHVAIGDLARRWLDRRYVRNIGGVRRWMTSRASSEIAGDARDATWAWEQLASGDLRLRPSRRDGRQVRLQHYHSYSRHLTEARATSIRQHVLRQANAAGVRTWLPTAEVL